MRLNGIWIAVVATLLVGIIPAQAEVCLPGSPPERLTVKIGLSGRPPSFIYGDWPARATEIQIEVSIQKSTGLEPVARYHINPDTAWSNPITVNGVRKTEVFLRGSGQTGFILFFTAGTYKARWRGFNNCESSLPGTRPGYGSWSGYTTFERIITSRPTTRITQGPSLVNSDRDVAFVWTNNFADEVYNVRIYDGRKAVRHAYGKGSFREGWMYEGRYIYRDRPSSPTLELPNGSNYSFRVKAWAPVNRRWSSWAVKNFTVARRTLPRSSLPSLSVSQRDFYGFFPDSPRPFFLAKYKRRVPALWTLYDIRRLENGRQRRVAIKWVSRYTSAKNGAGRGSNPRVISLGGAEAFADMRPGTYIWRVKAHSGHTQWWDGSRRVNNARWSPFRTNRIVAARTLERPGTNGFRLRNGSIRIPGYYYAEDEVNQPEYLIWASSYSQLRGKIQWYTVPNAFAYKVQILRNGRLYRVYNSLDPRSRKVTINRSGRRILFMRSPFPPGEYQFRIQAINKANTSRRQKSWWSPWSSVQVVR